MPGLGQTPVITVALVKGPINSPPVRHCASFVITGDAMQKLNAGGLSAIRVQQLPAVAGAVVQVPVAESQTLPGGPGVPLKVGPVHTSGGTQAQAEGPMLQQPTGGGAIVVDVVDEDVVDEVPVVVVEVVVLVVVVVAAGPPGQATPSAAASG